MVLDSSRSRRQRHTKSRSGCMECKKRHIKCGEEMLDCRSCVIRHIDCVYQRRNSISEKRTKPFPRNEQQISPSPSSEDSYVVLTPYQLQSHHPVSNFELQDLRLLHHWILYTSRSISQCWSVEGCCCASLFRLGLDHPFVMHGILGITSLHLASVEPPDEQKLLQTAVLHHNRGLEQVRHLNLQRMEASEDALHAFSVLNLLYTLITFGPLAGLMGKADKSNQPINPDWIRQVRATKPADESWQYPVPFEDIDAKIEPAAEEDHLVHIRETYRENNMSDVEVYGSTLQLLRRCYNYSSCPGSNHVDDQTLCDFNKWDGLLNFLYHLSDEYLDKLHQRQPPALIIFSFFGASLSLQDEAWLNKGWAKSIVSAVDTILGSYWAPYTEWCREIVALRFIEAGE